MTSEKNLDSEVFNFLLLEVLDVEARLEFKEFEVGFSLVVPMKELIEC